MQPGQRPSLRAEAGLRDPAGTLPTANPDKEGDRVSLEAEPARLRSGFPSTDAAHLAWRREGTASRQAGPEVDAQWGASHQDTAASPIVTVVQGGEE